MCGLNYLYGWQAFNFALFPVHTVNVHRYLSSPHSELRKVSNSSRQTKTCMPVQKRLRSTSPNGNHKNNSKHQESKNRSHYEMTSANVILHSSESPTTQACRTCNQNRTATLSVARRDAKFASSTSSVTLFASTTVGWNHPRPPRGDDA